MPGFLKITVQKLRKNQTETEKVIWEIVRNRRLNGHKFLRQHSIRFNYYGKVRFFVADFYSAKLKLVIEVDGKFMRISTSMTNIGRLSLINWEFE